MDLTVADRNVFYIIGDDATSRISELSRVVDEIVGQEDKSLCVETFDLVDAEDQEARMAVIESAVSSLLSPPFLTSMRVVILREIGSASSDEVASLINYLENPSPASYLVAVQGGGRISTLLTKAWKPYVVQRGNAKESVHDMFARRMREEQMKFTPGVKESVLSHCGEDSSKLSAFFDRIVNVYGQGVSLSLDDVSQYLGESGNVAIYQLSNEISSGNIAQSLEIVSRMLHSTSAQNEKPMHPLQIVSMLVNHFRKLAVLSDPSIRNQNDAFAALNKKGNPYGAKKSWELARTLGSRQVMIALEMISAMDVALKGANALDAQITLELGIISLCQLCERHDGVQGDLILREFAEALYL